MFKTTTRQFNVYNRFNKCIDTVTYASNFNSADVQRDLENRGEYGGKEITVRLARDVKRGKNITTVLKQAKTVLFTDDEYFNKDITGVKSLADIKDQFSIKGTLKKTGESGNEYRYQLVDSMYNFTIKCID